MKKLNWTFKGIMLTGILAVLPQFSMSQTTVSFTYTGAAQNWVVPNCVTSITVVAEGAEGATIGTCQGGDGAVVTATIPVNPGDNVTIDVGGMGVGAAAGYNGGGIGWNSTDGTVAWGSGGGGGSTDVLVNGVPVVIAAGGGGAGGGSVSYNNGGNGGCATGSAGTNTYGAGGGGGTQTAGGNGGAPWAGVPPGGQAGSFGQGGNGGLWVTASGGGGGGGYFGGGGGGNDGCCTGANGGGGGGGGSSLVPGGAGCVAGANTGNGVVTITYTGGAATASISPALICEGATTTITLSGAAGAFQWEQSTDGGTTWTAIPGATTTPYVTGPLTVNTCFRANEPGGGCSGMPYSNVVCATVSPPPTPDAGLDDSICHSTTAGYPLQGAASVGGNTTWSFVGPTGTPAPPNVIFTPASTSPTATATANYPGMYTFTLTETDPTGVCPNGTDQVNIFFAKETHTTSFTDPTCFGYADGTITITSTGNVGAIEYSFDGGATYQPASTQGGLLAGTYTVVSRDVVGCTATSTVTLTDPAPITITVSNDTTVCENGTATVWASGAGGTTYTYHWSQTADPGASQPVSPTAPTSVDVYAESELGCFSPTETINIDLYSPITLSITPNDTICPGYASGMTVNAAGGHLGYTYAWTANGATFPGGSNTISMNPSVQTQYCVTVSDGCETTPVNICSNVIMREVPNPTFATDTNAQCAPWPITFWNTTDYFLTDAYTDSITWIVEGVVYHDSTFTHNFVNVGEYDVYMEVYTQYGCHNSISADEYISIYGKPDVLFYTNPNPTTIFATEVTLTDLSTPGNNTYYWEIPGATPSASTEQSPVVVYPEGVAGTYPVKLTVTNEYNCFNSAEAEVVIMPDVLIYAPNVFTPDGDEFNETWRVYMEGIDIYDFHLTIFNRWGEVVWESYDVTASWDGTYGSTKAKSGTYAWMIEVKDANSDKKHEFRGHVTVLK